MSGLAFDKAKSCPPSGVAESARDRPGGQLHERAKPDELVDQLRSLLHLVVSLWMRKHRTYALCDQPLHNERQAQSPTVVGHLEEQIVRVTGEAEALTLAGVEVLERVQVELGAGEDRDRDRDVLAHELPPQSAHLSLHPFGRRGKIATHVRGRRYRLDTSARGFGEHLDALAQRAGPIIDERQDVRVQIDHGVAVRRRYPGGLPARHASGGYPKPPYRPSQRPCPVPRGASGVTRVVATAAAAIIAMIVLAPPVLPVTGPTTRHPVEWDGRSFSVSADLAAWLRARGATYETWAERHPTAAARLEALDPEGASGATNELEEPVGRIAGDDLSTPNIWSSTSGKVAVAFFVLALSLLLVPVVPRSIFARAQAEAVWERRLDLAAVGLAVAAGLAIVLIL